nr:hypothetical protein [Tanacetum cinerariifolium]GEY43903.1 hypothetical protein [Tanacetum cinerariifolium]
MADNRTMEEMLQAPTEGYGDAIVVSDILAENFEIRTGLLSLIQANQFHGFEMSTTSSGSSSSTDAWIDKLTDTISNLVETFNKKMTTPTTVKAVGETCVICGGAHPYYECIAIDSNTSSTCATTGTYNQGGPQNRTSNQMGPPGFPPVQNNSKNYFNQNQRNNVNRGNNFQGNQGFQAQINHALNFQVPNNQVQNFQSTLRSQNNKIDQNQSVIKKMFAYLMNNPSGSGSLPSNTIANSRGDLKAITTRSGVSYDRQPIPDPFSSLPKVVERVPEMTKDTPNPTIPYPLRVTKQNLREKDDNLALKFVKNFRKLHFDLSFADALLHMPNFALMFKSLLNDKEKLFDLAMTLVNENCSAVILKKLPEKLGDPGKRLYLEEIEACLTSKSIPLGIDDTDLDLEGDILLLEELLNNDPSSSPLPPKELNVEEIKTAKSSIDEPPELELKELPSHLECAFL